MRKSFTLVSAFILLFSLSSISYGVPVFTWLNEPGFSGFGKSASALVSEAGTDEGIDMADVVGGDGSAITRLFDNSSGSEVSFDLRARAGVDGVGLIDTGPDMAFAGIRFWRSFQLSGSSEQWALGLSLDSFRGILNTSAGSNDITNAKYSATVKVVSGDFNTYSSAASTVDGLGFSFSGEANNGTDATVSNFPFGINICKDQTDPTILAIFCLRQGRASNGTYTLMGELTVESYSDSPGIFNLTSGPAESNFWNGDNGFAFTFLTPVGTSPPPPPQSVPEPSSLLLLGIGTMSLGLIRRRRSPRG